MELSETFQQMCEIADNFDQSRWAEVDMNFHRLIFFSTGNNFYLPFGNVLATIFMSLIHHSSKDGGVYIGEHRAIYDAIWQVMRKKHAKLHNNCFKKKNTAYQTKCLLNSKNADIPPISAFFIPSPLYRPNVS
ncbi:Hypothetical GntR-famly transcriptional regulator [Photobacterium profundum 3TCK]|uniref:Hypothetical GntR-famly transcriptional regulator n=1 Tax=Photobacterium profundum 3TCK TaxID=314280 RepID=Q1ZA35_9GAMM|nr:Hypothetical GntR-famly transcriptional regulator [Photobacterium profundum 3TCK]